MFNGFRYTDEPNKNHWYELYSAQDSIARLIRMYLMKRYQLKFTDSVDEMHNTILDDASDYLNELSDHSPTFQEVEQESLGITLDIKIHFLGSDLSGFVVDDIKVEIV